MDKKKGKYKLLQQDQESAPSVDLAGLIKILRENPHMIENEKNNYSADKLMMLLDKEKLAALEEEFKEQPDGIEMPNYIYLMKSAISAPAKDKYELVNGLINLFEDIDINGDRHMEWKEFTQYIIDTVIGQQNTKFFDARLEKERELDEIEILENAYSIKAKRYQVSSQVDKSIHSSIIKKLIYEEKNDMLMVLENSQTRIKLLDQSQAMDKHQLAQQVTSICLPPNETNTKNFILDFAYSPELNIIGAITSDRLNYFWENNKNFKLVKQFRSDVLSTGIWWLQNHKYWVKAGADYNIRGYQWDHHNQELQQVFNLQAHSKQITDIVEISQPKLLASSSLDKKIRLYDLTEMKLLTEFKDPNSTRGIRGLAYSDEFGGNLLSYGFEYYVNVWCPQISLTRAQIGKLEGHGSIIVGCKFVKESPNVITIDDKTNIRVWDIRILQTVQVISNDLGTLLVNDIEIITKHDKFVLGGKRLQFYENQAYGKNMKAIQEEVHPLAISFNGYFNQFVVLSKLDIRLYDALTGKLKKVMNFSQEDQIQPDLTNFDFGGRQRKIFLSDNTGLIKLYNLRDGEFLKSVNNLQELKRNDFESKSAHIPKKENIEVNALLFFHQRNLLVTGLSDSTVRIYDESNPDSTQSELLKVLSGGHRDSEVTAVEVNDELNLVLSGSANGMLTMWSLETGQYYDSCLAHSMDVVSIKSIHKYAIVITASLDGTMALWRIEGQTRTFQFILLARFSNSAKDKHDKEVLTGITQMVVLQGHMEALPVRRQSCLWHRPEPAPPAFKKSHFKELFDEYYDTAPGAALQQIQQEHQRILKRENRPIQEYNEQLVDSAILEYMYDEVHLRESQAEQKNRVYVVVADQTGHIGLVALTHTLYLLGTQPVLADDAANQTTVFQLKRKELINAQKLVESRLEKQTHANLGLKCLRMGESVGLLRWRAHKNHPVTALTLVDSPVSLVTGSLDKRVKVWSIAGQSYGGFHMTKLSANNNWTFPFDWVKLKLEQMEKVFDTLEFLEKSKEKKSKEEKDKIKYEYLYNKYFHGQHALAGPKGSQPPTSLKSSRMIKHKVHKASAEVSSQNMVYDNYHDDQDEQKIAKCKREIEKENEKLLKSTQRSLTVQEAKQEKLKQYMKSEMGHKVMQKMNDIDQQNNLYFAKASEPLEHSKNSTHYPQKKKNNNLSSSSNNQSQYSSSINFNLDSKKRLMHSKFDKLPTVQESQPKKEKEKKKRKELFNEKECNEMAVHSVKSMKVIDKSALQPRSNAFYSHQKHSQFIKRLMLSIPSKIKTKLDPRFHDIKHRPEEGSRALQIASHCQKNYFIANSQNMQCDNNRVLQQQMKYYANNTNQDNVNSEALNKKPEIKRAQKKTDDQRQIVASKAFITNPYDNKHKILKTDDKIYALKGRD